MTLLERLGAPDLRATVTAYRDALRAHQDAVNRLNVYPVPDGDTGTNMALTLESVVAALDGCVDMPSTCKAISHGSLMGARGNSGVILSQILRGVADGCKDGDGAGPKELADALEMASQAAYGAVMRPVEGTILTVVRESAAGARGAADAGKTLVDVLDAARAAGAEALERTPELLPVLKQAGVVDAGGAGFLLFLDAALHVAAGRLLPEPPVMADSGTGAGALSPEIAAAHDEDNVSGLRYEVMYFLEAPDETVPAFKDVWAGVGDSIVVVGGDGIWNCHIHTDDIGAAIEAALDAGRPRNIRVTDLFEQVEEERWVREAATAAPTEPEPEPVPVPTAVVAVATGDGIRRIFRSLGVQQIVTGGQSMNPSTQQILEAVEAAPAGEVVILPNNKNIVAVAEQVAPLTGKAVRVLPTHSIVQGFAALLEYDPYASADENATSMLAAAGRVVSGEVTRAVRDSYSDAGPIREGDWLGLSGKRIEVVSGSLGEAGCDLLAKLVTDDHEIVTVIEGEGATAADTRRITEWLGEHRPDVSTEVHHGGQPLYPYLFSIE
ncbi:MAG TPA: DAK2 domain-containing protein [Acidimicrobiales bacterium]|nr:DAK2 domain-containing protein [Acidimicrobiales bacterium]